MPDSLLLNAKIYTLDSRQPRVSALALRDGKILAAGADDEMRALAGAHTQVFDLHGRAVLPGLTDAHLHFEWYAFGLQDINAETDTLDECLQRVQTRAQSTPPGQWIEGYGWNHNVWGLGGAFPTAADLDRVAPAHPVLLQAKSGHAAWVNSLALRLAGIAPDTANPDGGQIDRDAHGAPSGILLEDAMGLVKRHIPERTAAELARAMLPAQANAWRAGLTGVHDFDGPRSFAAWQMLKERGQLGLRVVKQIQAPYLNQALELGLRSGFGDDWLRLGNVKVFMDGALGPRTAAMFEPYEGEPDNCGIMVTDKEELYELAARASAGGLALSVHAIGDRANHEVLDVYEALWREEQNRGERSAPLRHRIEHVQLLHPQDYQRLGQLGVIASMQPLHATSDMQMADRYWGQRSAGAYAWRTQLNTGATLAFGSDCPVENFNPFWGIHAAVTRRRADGAPGPEGWYPEQRLTVAEAVRGFTQGAAYAGRMEDRLGSLSPGKLADLIVVDRGIFVCDPMDIKDTQVLGAMVGGEWKFSNVS